MFGTNKASTAARGYGAAHQKLRARLLPHAYGQPCTRCGGPMHPGQALHLDHTDTRDGYAGFAHAACNRKAGARKGQRRQRAQIAATMRPKLDNTREW
jgi:hypothetical protein